MLLSQDVAVSSVNLPPLSVHRAGFRHVRQGAQKLARCTYADCAGRRGGPKGFAARHGTVYGNFHAAWNYVPFAWKYVPRSSAVHHFEKMLFVGTFLTSPTQEKHGFFSCIGTFYSEPRTNGSHQTAADSAISGKKTSSTSWAAASWRRSGIWFTSCCQ